MHNRELRQMYIDTMALKRGTDQLLDKAERLIEETKSRLAQSPQHSHLSQDPDASVASPSSAVGRPE